MSGKDPMMLHEVDPVSLNLNPFDAIGNGWMLVAAERDGKVNAMTASWGGLGVMWRKNVAFVVIRPQRYTKEFVDVSPVFSINFLGEEHRKALNYFGTVSGRQEDKIATTGLAVERVEGAPVFKDATLAMVCRKMFAQPYEEGSFLDRGVDADCYPDKDYHTLYIGEIIKTFSAR